MGNESRRIVMLGGNGYDMPLFKILFDASVGCEPQPGDGSPA